MRRSPSRNRRIALRPKTPDRGCGRWTGLAECSGYADRQARMQNQNRTVDRCGFFVASGRLVLPVEDRLLISWITRLCLVLLGSVMCHPAGVMHCLVVPCLVRLHAAAPAVSCYLYGQAESKKILPATCGEDFLRMARSEGASDRSGYCTSAVVIPAESAGWKSPTLMRFSSETPSER